MVSVCVVNWRTAEETIRLAHSLEAGLDGIPYELCIVDNASEDGSALRLRTELPHAAVIESQSNVGFGAGVNLAAAATSGEYLLVLNPDTLVRPGAVRILLDALHSNPRAAVAAPRLVDRKGRRHASARRFPTATAAMFRGTPLGWLFPRNRWAARYLMEDVDLSRTSEVDWVSGSAMLVRRDAFASVGGFDEGFFMYCEDVDLCKRLRSHGWSTLYVPEAVIEHRVGASSDKAQVAMIRAHHRSMLRYYRKHLAGNAPLPVRALYPLGISVRYLLLRLRRRLVWWRQHKVGGSDRV